MFKILSLLSILAMANASTTIRRLLQQPPANVQPVVPMAGVAAGAGYGVMPGFGGAPAMGNGGGVVPGYGAPAMGNAMGMGGGNGMANGMANGAVVPGYGAGAPAYGMNGNMNGGNLNGPQPVVPYGGVAPPAGMQWVLGLEPLYPGQVVPNNGVPVQYEQPGSEGR